MDESNETPVNPTTPGVTPEPSLGDLMSDLNLTPTWAKTGGAGGSSSRDFSGYEPREDRGRDRRGPPRMGAGGPRSDRPRGPRPGGDGPRGERGAGKREGGRRDRFAGRPPREERPPRLPIDISFIPERVQLNAVVRQMHQSARAYPLIELARLFLSKPEYHVVKFESRAPDLRFHVSKTDQHLFLSEEALRAHVRSRLLEHYFEPVDIETEPLKGNFVVVGRCRASGELLGPPNHHAFQERLLELHRSRFAHLPLAEYRSRIEMVRDPAVVEQWREKSRVQRVYREKGVADAPNLKRAEAEARLMAEHAKDLQQVTGRVLISARIALEMQDEELARAVREAGARETRNPMRMVMALRPAFRAMHMHFFKGGRGEVLVSAVAPKPVDPANTIEPLRKLIEWVAAHAGSTKAQLLEALLPGKPPEEPAVVEASGQLRWLVEKGHIIEFFNGTMMVPTVQHAPEPQEPAETKSEEKGETIVTPEAPSASEPAPPVPPPSA